MFIELLILGLIITPLIYWATELYRRLSLKKQILDVPNERSSHISPTPRGAGIVIGVFTLVYYLAVQLYIGEPVVWEYLTGGAIILTISYADDLKGVSVGWRFLCHATTAVLLILGYFRMIGEANFLTDFQGVWFFLMTGSFLAIVWCINAYNFMDGIDGIAGLQALVAAFGWFWFAVFSGEIDLRLFAVGAGFSAFGFLMLNWNPAKIFLGDAGSAFWGYTFAALPFIYSGKETAAFRSDKFLWAGILIWPFIFDTVLTFLRRLIRKEKVWKPHREHFYQKLIIGGLSHKRVSLIYGALSLLPILVFIILRGRLLEFLWLFVVIVVFEAIVLVILTFTITGARGRNQLDGAGIE